MKQFSMLLCIMLGINSLQGQSLSNLSFGSDSTLEVATWNIERFPKRTTTPDSVQAILRALDIDLWGLQEIDDSNDLKTAVSMLPNMKVSFGTGYYAGLAYVWDTTVIKNAQVYKIFTDRSYWNPLPRAPLVIEFDYLDSHMVVVNNHFKCCGNGVWEKTNANDEETRRYTGHRFIMDYVDSIWANQKVMVIGDLNDILSDNRSNNIFQKELDDTSNYRFVDLAISKATSTNWSYPSWPSHLDHILITKDLIPTLSSSETACIRIDDHLRGGWSTYDNQISDHRPVAYKMKFESGSDPSTSSVSPERMNKVTEIKAYPNPFNSFLVIETNRRDSCFVYNAKGQLIRSIQLEAGINEISTDDLPRGMYYLKSGGKTLELLKQ